jgi:hypothetical protein
MRPNYLQTACFTTKFSTNRAPLRADPQRLNEGIAAIKKIELQFSTLLATRAAKSCVLVALKFESPSSAWPDENPDPFTGRITSPFSANQGLHF